MAAKWVRIFEVPETKRHSKGHTIYQVKSTVFPRSSPEASTSVVVWRRYSDLRRLYKAIHEIHRKMGLPGQLPPFPRATLLNRFEADVVEARRQAALDLFKFIGQHSALFTSEPFTKFFESDDSDGKRNNDSPAKRKDSKGRSKEAEHLASTLGIQGLSSLYSQMSDTEDDFSVCSSLDSPTSPTSLGPVFPLSYDSSLTARPRTVEAVSNKGDGTISNENMHNSSIITPVSKEIKHNLRESTIDNNARELDSQMQNYQNSSAGTSRNPDRKGVDLSWNLLYDNSVEEEIFNFDTENSCDPRRDPNHNQSERHPSVSSLSSVSSQPCCIYENPVHDSPKHHQKPYPNEDDTQSSDAMATQEKGSRPLPPIDVSRKISITGRKNSVPLTPLTPLTKSVIPVVPNSKVPSPQEVASSQYIFVAAQQISEAQLHEQKKDYKQALNMYREGVGTLLQGVQGDGDGSRREAVRRKTAQYLQRAEQLVARLTRKDKRKDQDCDGSAVEADVNGEAGLKCRASDLKRYRVAGSTGSIIIATDTTNGDTVAIKVLIKSGSGSGEKTIVPQNVPYMVPIIRYHETDSAIYLVLKFISGGKLWSHIGKYVSETNPGHGELFDITRANTYAGHRFLLENTDCDGLAVDGLSLCETPSMISNISSQQSCPLPPPPSNNLLSVPDNGSVDGCSTCSEASSSCLPDGYLPIFSDYTPSLPSSSSMVVIPRAGNDANQDGDSVPKSSSTGALTMESTCTEEGALKDIEKVKDAKLSTAEERDIIGGAVCEIRNTTEINGDSISIGSDTLSGVSEDFSCSLPPNVPDLLPDPIPLPEVKITFDAVEADESYLKNEEKNYDHNFQAEGHGHTSSGKETVIEEVPCYLSDVGADVQCDSLYRLCDNVEGSSDTGKGASAVLVTRVGTGSPDTHLKVDEDKDDISVTDTSFASVTLPSFSWTKREDSELASLDIEDLIRNSKMLLQNVDHTLQQSKTQSVLAFNDSDDSGSVEHSELPFDGASAAPDQQDKLKTVSKGEKCHDIKNCSQVATVYDTTAAHLEIEVSSQKTGTIEKELSKDSNSLTLPSKPSTRESEEKEKNAAEKNEAENEVGSQNTKPPSNDLVEEPGDTTDDNRNYSVGVNESKDNLSPGEYAEPLENSIGSLLEQYSANRGHDARPRLPEGIVKIWSSQVISALTALHTLGIIWGDFNPDNVLLDEGGSILLTYESRWSCVQHDIRGGKGWKIMDGEAFHVWKGYLAPELESPLTYPSAASDWWSVGALMYHMLTGQSVSAAHPCGVTSHTELFMPSHLSPEAASLLSQLLCAHPTERLGGGIAGPQEIKDHAFFTGIQWTE
ncbi:ribosomal protein S6 kinase delta-1 isoform X2 [Macrobrachium rosenbergii]|uniref:ribosomal protein S6 kinase delta-1 isoform X2 n=1 Tax=Macrobrachium rosenbergii TaxID=79674 RepID=UPI0034D6C0DA